MAPKRPLSAVSSPHSTSSRSVEKKSRSTIRPAIIKIIKTTKTKLSRRIHRHATATQILAAASNTEVVSETEKATLLESSPSRIVSGEMVSVSRRNATATKSTTRVENAKQSFKPRKPRPQDKKKILPFLSLPTELRNMIYDHLLVSETAIYLTMPAAGNSANYDQVEKWTLYPGDSPATDGLHPAISQTCKLLFRETIPILYGRNTFIHGLPSDGSVPKLYLPFRHLKYVRRLKVQISFPYISPRSPCNPYIWEDYFRRVVDVRASQFLEKFKRAQSQLEIVEIRVQGFEVAPQRGGIHNILKEKILSNSCILKSLKNLKPTSEMGFHFLGLLEAAEGTVECMVRAMEKFGGGKRVPKCYSELGKSEGWWRIKMEDRKPDKRLSMEP